MDSNGFNTNQQSGMNDAQQGNGYQQPYTNAGGGYTSPDYSNPYGSYGNDQGGQVQVKAPNVFQQFAYAFVPPKYGSLAKVKTGSMIGFVVLLTLVATLLSAAKFFIGFSSIGNSLDFMDEIPDFGLEDGRFFIDEEFMYEEDTIFIYMTDEISGFDFDDADYARELGYSNILLVGRDKISIMQDGEYQEARFKDLNLGGDVTINKEWIEETVLPALSVIMVIGYVLFFIFRTLWYFFCAMLYFLVALAAAAIMRRKVTAGALYKTAVYSKVLMFVVATVLGLIPFIHIGVPGIIRTVITIVFMCFAISKLPRNV